MSTPKRKPAVWYGWREATDTSDRRVVRAQTIADAQGWASLNAPFPGGCCDAAGQAPYSHGLATPNWVKGAIVEMERQGLQTITLKRQPRVIRSIDELRSYGKGR